MFAVIVNPVAARRPSLAVPLGSETVHSCHLPSSR